MEFLVRTELVSSLPEVGREELFSAERAEGLRLRDAGIIREMWRIPGRQANIAVMRAEDATQLHATLASLPLWPYTTVTVEALADHPLMEEPRG